MPLQVTAVPMGEGRKQRQDTPRETPEGGHKFMPVSPLFRLFRRYLYVDCPQDSNEHLVYSQPTQNSSGRDERYA